eukprot:g15762.t2
MAGLLRFSSSCAITGASEGLGAVVALHLAKAGAKKLILGARRMEKLLKVKEDVVKQSPSVDAQDSAPSGPNQEGASYGTMNVA